MPEFLYGHWAVIEAMRSGRRKLISLMIHDRAERRGTTGEAMSMADELNIPVQRVQRRILDDLANNGNHQGLVLRVGPFPYCDVEEILQTAALRGEKPFVLLLDLLKDPQNVGSLIRVSDAVGIHGIVIQERRSVAVTPAVVNASSGAVRTRQCGAGDKPGDGHERIERSGYLAGWPGCWRQYSPARQD